MSTDDLVSNGRMRTTLKVEEVKAVASVHAGSSTKINLDYVTLILLIDVASPLGLTSSPTVGIVTSIPTVGPNMLLE